MSGASGEPRTPLLQIRGLHVGFRKAGAVTEVVHGVDIAIDEHETLALVGESGSGKTVTAQSVLRLIPETIIAYPAGQILFRGEDILRLPPEALLLVRGAEIGMIFQEPMSSLNPLHTVEKQLSETILLHRRASSAEVRKEAHRWLQKVGLTDPDKKLSSFPHQLSGGERQRVMIAMALINGPRLLIADEPTTALDVTIQAQILDLIKELQRELGMAVLFITHDLGIVRRIADRVAVMHDGHIVEMAATEQIFRAPAHEYTRVLLNAEPHQDPPQSDPNLPVLLEAHQMKVWFPIQHGFLRRTTGYVKAVDGIDLTLRQGQTVGVAGESGSGKTTLGRALLRLIRCGGEMNFEGVDIQALREDALRSLRRRMQIIFQDPFGSLNPRMSIARIIGEGLEINNIGNAESRESLIRETMVEVGLDPEIADRFPHEFSGGQRQRIALARALVLKPALLILDEPTSSLDRTIQYQVIALLKELQHRHGLTYIFISHDLKVLKSLCHDLVIMRRGKVVEAGPATSVFSAPQHPYTRELIATAFE